MKYKKIFFFLCFFCNTLFLLFIFGCKSEMKNDDSNQYFTNIQNIRVIHECLCKYSHRGPQGCQDEPMYSNEKRMRMGTNTQWINSDTTLRSSRILAEIGTEIQNLKIDSNSCTSFIPCFAVYVHYKDKTSDKLCLGYNSIKRNGVVMKNSNKLQRLIRYYSGYYSVQTIDYLIEEHPELDYIISTYL